MAIKDIPASTILDIQNLIAQAPAYINALVNAGIKVSILKQGLNKSKEPNYSINPTDYNSASKQLLDWFNSTIKPNAASTKDAKATISSTFTSVADFASSFFNIRTSVMLADPTAVAFLDTWFNKYSKLTVIVRPEKTSLDR